MATRHLLKTYRYRLCPTQEQEQQFRRFAGCRRKVWNLALQRRKDYYQQTGKTLSYKQQAAELVAWKQTEELSYLAECDSQVLQQVLRDLDRAFVNFFQKRAGYPKPKSKRKTPNAFRIPQRVRVQEGKVVLPKIGLVEVLLHRSLEGVPKSATIKQEPTGHWYIAFVCQIERPDSEPVSVQNPVGIDVGLDSFVSTSQGQKVKAPRFYRQAKRKLRRAQHKVSRRYDKNKAQAKQPQSQNYYKAKQELARLHARIHQQRNDFLHKLSHHLVSEHDLLVIEDLAVSALTKTKLRGHAKSWYDAAASTFRRLLSYKCEWYSKRLIVVDRWFPSSKRCHVCHYVYADLNLSQREWQCPCCDSLHDRDSNGATNLLEEGLALLRQQSEGPSAAMPVEEASDSRKGAASNEAGNAEKRFLAAHRL